VAAVVSASVVALQRTTEVVAYSFVEVSQMWPMLSWDYLAYTSSSGVVGIVVDIVVAQTVAVDIVLDSADNVVPYTAVVVPEGIVSKCGCHPLSKCL
jgi:hypothetical protein